MKRPGPMSLAEAKSELEEFFAGFAFGGGLIEANLAIDIAELIRPFTSKLEKKVSTQGIVESGQFEPVRTVDRVNHGLGNFVFPLGFVHGSPDDFFQQCANEDGLGSFGARPLKGNL